MKKNNSISLIDGSGFIFRAYYALPALTNKDGVPVGAVMGFCNMLYKLLEEKKTEKIIVIFDTARKTFRNTIYKSYKANRGEPPEDLIPQFSLIRDAVDAFNISRKELAGYEADDLIATYSKFFTNKGWEVSIISSDKDLMQLVKENVYMVDPIKNKVITKDEVKDKFGVPPAKVIDVQSLAGDSIDNIPGAPGIGIKTGAQLINQFQSLENLLLNYSDIKQNKRREAIEKNIEAIRISKKLVTLKDDISINIDIDKISDCQIVEDKLIPFLEKNGFNNLKKRIENKEQNKIFFPAEQTFVQSKYQSIQCERDLQDFLDIAINSDKLVIDTETDSLKAMDAKLVGISLAYNEEQAFYIPINHTKTDNQKQLDLNFVINKLNPLLSNSSILKIGQNIKFDLHVLKNNGFGPVYPLDDTMLMSYTLSAGLHNHNLDYLAEKYLGYKKVTYKSIVGTGKKEINFADVEIIEATKYACEDVDVTLKVWINIKNLLAKNKLLKVYEYIERPLIKTIVIMEENGITINKEKLKKLSNSFSKQIEKLQNKIFILTKSEFNINSTKQLGEILFNKLKLPGEKKNKSGTFSTNSEILELLAEQGYKIASLVLEYREISKLKSTYTESLINNISKKTNRIHTTFQMAGAQTGRLSSTDPNLQNIPIKSQNGKEIRKTFVAKKGYKLVCFDYSQIELRLLAEMASIDKLRDAFFKGFDIHKLTASQIFNISVNEVSENQRRDAKAINFGIIYGLSAFGLSKQIGISRQDAKKYIDAYFFQYPGIEKYMENMKSYVFEKGYVKTLFGRKINIKGYKDKNSMVRNYANRQAINAPIQGTAADMIKRAMIKYHKISNDKIFNDTKLLLQVHDELIFEIKNDSNLPLAINKITKLMANANLPIINFSTPIEVSLGKGDNWDEAH
ncbi:MAG: DNA polymerase I [Rickettsiales bacterium TMED131]|nr:MAG: DNA polymerase I [Rickettsiales bacterium TMED131]